MPPPTPLPAYTATAPSTNPAQSFSPGNPAPSTAGTAVPARQASILDALRTIKVSDFSSIHQKACARESLLTGIGAGFAIGGLRFISLSGASRRQQETKTEVWTSRTGARKNAHAGTAAEGASTTTSTTTSKLGPGAKPRSALTSSTGAESANVSSPRHRPLATAAARSAIPSNSTLSARAWRSMTWAVLSFALFSAGSHVFCQRRRKLEQVAMARAAEIVARKRAEKSAALLRRREERERDRESRRREHEEGKMARSRWGRWFGSSSSSSSSSSFASSSSSSSATTTTSSFATGGSSGSTVAGGSADSDSGA